MVIDILQISREAREAKRHFHDVVDGSVGMFIDEEGFVGGLPIVYENLVKMAPEQLIPYPAVDGGQPFKDNVFGWVFQGYEHLIKEHFHTYVVATPGGSGAIAAVLHNHSNPGDEVLVSDIRWQYDRFAEPARLKLHHHPLFKGDKFDLEGFTRELKALCQIQHRVIVIINDPCQNPSGYTLTHEEWLGILEALNRQTANEIIFLYDIAYIDYSCEVDQRAKAAELVKLAPHVNVFLAFSGSKTFGTYGIRVGALIGLGRDADWIAKSRNLVFNFARGTWSCTPTPAIELVNRMLSPEMKPAFLEGLKRARATIIKRGQLFLEQAKAVGLPLVPYRNGFYVIVTCPNSYEVYQKLTEHRIYAVPVDQGIRMALCSMSLKDIDGLPARLKKIIFQK
ncbi:MAG: aminotransferase class I/II-fold pyridoxal phosphate-dependent enzyme [Bacilli bacterium]|jgi:aspartate/tyrosine/aromatic aminotransferase